MTLEASVGKNRLRMTPQFSFSRHIMRLLRKVRSQRRIKVIFERRAPWRGGITRNENKFEMQLPWAYRGVSGCWNGLMDTRNRRISSSHRLNSIMVLCLLLASSMLALAACNAAVPQVTPSATPGTATPFPPTDTPSPSPTATPESSLVILLAPPGSDGALADRLEELLTGLASEAGMRFQTRPDLSPAELQQDVKLVVVLPPDPGIAELAAASPETQFLAVGVPGLEAGGNISTINISGNSPDQAGFAAGYLGAAITPDWRVGVISEQDTTGGKATQLGFTNGVIYFCGLCRPVNPPYPIPGYPLTAQLTDAAGPAEWQAVISNLTVWGVGTVFVDPEIASEGLYQELAKAGINIIGSGEPPPGLKDHWVASIGSSDPVEAVNKLWPDVIRGEGGMNVGLPLTIHAANLDLFSPGRQALVDEMLGELAQGYIDTGVDPSTGDSRY